MPSNTEKRDINRKLEKLLDVAGTDLPWAELDLAERLTLPAMRALLYRVERARAESYEEGTQHSEKWAL